MMDGAGPEHVHFLVEAVIYNEIVRHSHTMRLHGMPLAVMVVAHLGIVKVGNSAVGGGGRHYQSRTGTVTGTVTGTDTALRRAHWLWHWRISPLLVPPFVLCARSKSISAF